jgi:hypothetical protein
MRKQPVIFFVAVLIIGLCSGQLLAEQVPVRYTEGLVHGFLVLRSQAGETLADGELRQTAHGNQVTTKLEFHFKDGSLHQETTVAYQGKTFQLISDHLIQKGPSFPHPIDVSITKSSGQVAIHYTDDDGKEKTINDHVTLPPDVANGLTLTLLPNIRPATPKITVSMLATTPKPRLVKLIITPNGEESFTVGNTKHTATHYVIKVDLGGVAGKVAPVVGKQPADIHVWILADEAPVFVKMEGPLYNEGPIWRIELASPTWPGESKQENKSKEH